MKARVFSCAYRDSAEPQSALQSARRVVQSRHERHGSYSRVLHGRGGGSNYRQVSFSSLPLHPARPTLRQDDRQEQAAPTGRCSWIHAAAARKSASQATQSLAWWHLREILEFSLKSPCNSPNIWLSCGHPETWHPLTRPASRNTAGANPTDKPGA